MRAQSIIGLGALAATMAGGMAAAQSTDGSAEVNIAGAASEACSVTAEFSPIDVGDMVDKVTGGLKASSVNGQTSTHTGRVACNGVTASLSLEANPITASSKLPDGASKAGFTNAVDYVATATIGGYSSLGVSSIQDKTWESSKATPVGLLVANAGQIVVTLSSSKLAGDGTFLMADKAYSGSVTLVVSPTS